MANISRRGILAAGLGGVALVAAGGAWRVTRTPQTAMGPWELDPNPPEDVRLDAFRHAILAPNPHNRQPWVIRLLGDSEAVITADLARDLPITDPFDRQITIGFGTFLEIARIAAAERGYAMMIEPFPDGEDPSGLDSRPVAHLRFEQADDVAREPLFAQIVRRRSNKEEYDLSRTVAASDLGAITSAGGSFTADPAIVSKLRDEIVSGIETEMLTHAANMESVELMRIGHAEVDANPDGIELHGPLIEAGKLVGMVNREELADPQSTGFHQGLEMMRSTYGSIPSLVWITTPANTRADQLEAGRQYVRANLEATALGLGMHPMSQSLQEYEEVQPMYARVHELLGATGNERVQMLARVGYGPPVEPTPRWPLETHLT
ncbi:Acg family FMN-binding oxidoreductase [Altererythrobacter sp. MF3-039]|uniref:Acg family FMN-binding oxidoreductase n=1 Tax=Altererythrobacter sp. MF3-039 TaxID=3252901 RepID=UPI00390C95A4